MKTVASLLSKDYSKLSGFELDDYIRLLKRELRKATLQNAYLLEEEQKMYIKELSDITSLPFNNEQLEFSNVDVSGDAFAITATIDPSKFPQLMLVPQHEQIKYFKKIFSKLIIDGEITNLYGSFEAHQNGNIHFHGIIYMYFTYEAKYRLEELISSYLTNRKYFRIAKSYDCRKQPDPDKGKNTIAKLVTDFPGWFIYMNKKPLDFIEWKIKKNSLDL